MLLLGWVFFFFWSFFCFLKKINNENSKNKIPLGSPGPSQLSSPHLQREAPQVGGRGEEGGQGWAKKIKEKKKNHFSVFFFLRKPQSLRVSGQEMWGPQASEASGGQQGSWGTSRTPPAWTWGWRLIFAGVPPAPGADSAPPFPRGSCERLSGPPLGSQGGGAGEARGNLRQGWGPQGRQNRVSVVDALFHGDFGGSWRWQRGTCFMP